MRSLVRSQLSPPKQKTDVKDVRFLFWRQLTRSKQLARSADLVRIPADERVKLACKRQGVEYCNSLRKAKNCKCQLSFFALKPDVKDVRFCFKPSQASSPPALPKGEPFNLFSLLYHYLFNKFFDIPPRYHRRLFCLSKLKTISENCALHLKISVL